MSLADFCRLPHSRLIPLNSQKWRLSPENSESSDRFGLGRPIIPEGKSNDRRDRQANDQPDFDHPPRRRADRHVEQSAGERARRGRAAGPCRGDRGGRGRRSDQGGRHPLRRADLLRGRRHHRIRQAAGHAVAANGGRRDRKLLQAGGCGDPRDGTWRRAGGGSRLPLSDCRKGREARRSGGQARPVAGCGRNAAPAARRRCPEGAGNVHVRRNGIGQGRLRRRAGRPPRRRRTGPACGRAGRRSA